MQSNLFRRSLDIYNITLSTTTHMLKTVSLVSIQNVLVNYSNNMLIAAQNSGTNGVVFIRFDCITNGRTL